MREQITIAAKLYECQKRAQALYKDEYKEKVQWYVNLLNAYSKEYKVETLKAAIVLGNLKIIKENGMALMMLMAATVEIIEPSKS